MKIYIVWKVIDGVIDDPMAMFSLREEAEAFVARVRSCCDKEVLLEEADFDTLVSGSTMESN